MLQTTQFKSDLDLETHVLHQYGKLFYRTDDLEEALRLFRLTRTFLEYALAESQEKPEKWHECLFADCGEIHDLLIGDKLVLFEAVAGHGRTIFHDNGCDPSDFVSTQTMQFARRTRRYLAHVQAT